jgi:hypothetical protein
LWVTQAHKLDPVNQTDVHLLGPQTRARARAEACEPFSSLLTSRNARPYSAAEDGSLRILVARGFAWEEIEKEFGHLLQRELYRPWVLIVSDVSQVDFRTWREGLNISCFLVAFVPALRLGIGGYRSIVRDVFAGINSFKAIEGLSHWLSIHSHRPQSADQMVKHSLDTIPVFEPSIWRLYR